MTAVEDLAVRAAKARLAEMSRAQKIASILMLHVPGTDEGTVRAFTAEHQPGGLIFMPDNVSADLADVRKLAEAASSDAEFPVLIGIDQEGGLVRRIASDGIASSVTLKHLPADQTRDAFAERARMLAEAGISVNFGIVADVTADADSFIFGRALGVSPVEAAARVAAAVTGERGQVLSTLKHFPGHGRTPGDSHSSIPETDIDLATWAITDAVPFERGIHAGADVVMVGHLRYSAVDDCPASLSAAWHGILRDQLGFDGVIITDDMLMLKDSGVPEYLDATRNAVRALAAGSTMLLYVFRGDAERDGSDPKNLIAGIDAAVDAGELSDAHIDTAVLRILTLRNRLAREKETPPAGTPTG